LRLRPLFFAAAAVHGAWRGQALQCGKLQRQAANDVPQCTRKLGTISIVDGDDARGWTQYNLAPPQKLLKVIVQRSNCFNIVDRGSGLQAAQRERDIAGDLGHQRGANVGQGQIKAADYVLQAEVQAANGNAQGSRIGRRLGGLVGGGGGALGGIKSRKLEANTVLSVTNVRTTETIATVEGYAAKNDISFGAGAAASSAAARWGGRRRL
jgi:curli biogenesis system outer membrane secretion channel CsgG